MVFRGLTNNIIFHGTKTSTPTGNLNNPCLTEIQTLNFYEERNLRVYATSKAFNGGQILYVYHNEDGDWQFHTSLKPNLDDSMLVCLEEIANLDPTINELYHLKFGWRAFRESREDEWEFEEYPDSG